MSASPTDSDDPYTVAFVLSRAFVIVFALLAALSVPLLQAAGAPAHVCTVVAWVLFSAAALCAFVMLMVYWYLARAARA